MELMKIEFIIKYIEGYIILNNLSSINQFFIPPGVGRSILTAAHCICDYDPDSGPPYASCNLNHASGSPENQIVPKNKRRGFERDVYYLAGEKSVPPEVRNMLERRSLQGTSLQLPKATKAIIYKTTMVANGEGHFKTPDIGIVTDTNGIQNYGNNVDYIPLASFVGE